MKKEFVELDKNDYLSYYSFLKKARELNKHGCFVDLGSPEDWKGRRCFILDDDVAGFSIDDSNIVGVIKNPTTSKEKGHKYVIGDIMMLAIKEGASKLDCFAAGLETMYMKHGFIPTGKMKFDPQAMPGWDIQKHGEPDVVAMCRAVVSSDELIKLSEEGSFLSYSEIEDLLPVYDDYDAMLHDRDIVFERILEHSKSYQESYNIILQFCEERRKNNE